MLHVRPVALGVRGSWQHVCHRKALLNPVIITSRFASMQSESNSTQETDASRQLMQISFKDAQGQLRTRNVKRSYPNAKSTKLQQGLEDLLAHSILDDVPGELPTSENITTKLETELIQPASYWALLNNGTGIYRNIRVNATVHDQLISRIKQEADTLNHHPHIAEVNISPDNTWIISILCTTHKPAGLSLKDVKLADSISKLLTSLHDHGHSISRVNSTHKPQASQLLQQNIQAADRAIANPESKCNTEIRQDPPPRPKSRPKSKIDSNPSPAQQASQAPHRRRRTLTYHHTPITQIKKSPNDPPIRRTFAPPQIRTSDTHSGPERLFRKVALDNDRDDGLTEPDDLEYNAFDRSEENTSSHTATGPGSPVRSLRVRTVFSMPELTGDGGGDQVPQPLSARELLMNAKQKTKKK